MKKETTESIKLAVFSGVAINLKEKGWEKEKEGQTHSITSEIPVIWLAFSIIVT